MAGAGKVMETCRFTSEITASYEAPSLLNGIAVDDNYFLWLRKIKLKTKHKLAQGGDAPGPTNVPGLCLMKRVTCQKLTLPFFLERMKAACLLMLSGLTKSW